MAITHNDLSLRKFQNADVSSRLALFLVSFSVLCGLAAFILCLVAEGSRSEVSVHSYLSSLNLRKFPSVMLDFCFAGDMVAYDHPWEPRLQVLLQQQRQGTTRLRCCRIPCACHSNVYRARLHARCCHQAPATWVGSLDCATGSQRNINIQRSHMASLLSLPLNLVRYTSESEQMNSSINLYLA